MNPCSVDIKDLLESESSFGLTFGQNLFVAKEPVSSADTVTVFDTPGRAPLLFLEGKTEIGYFFPSIQIRVRGSSYQTVWNLMNAIKLFLHGMNNFIINSTNYELIACRQEPALLDWDAQGKVRIVATFEVQRNG